MQCSVKRRIERCCAGPRQPNLLVSDDGTELTSHAFLSGASGGGVPGILSLRRDVSYWALLGRADRPLSCLLLGVLLPCQPATGEAVHDLSRPFATVTYRSAKDSPDRHWLPIWSHAK